MGAMLEAKAQRKHTRAYLYLICLVVAAGGSVPTADVLIVQTRRWGHRRYS